MNSMKYNIEHQRLNKQLEEINRQRRELRETKLRDKYQSTKDDPSSTFYQIMSEQKKRKRLIESCDIMNDDGTVKEKLSHPAEIAAHISATYAKLFNSKSQTSMQTLKEFLGIDIDKIGKITEDIKSELCNELTATEMKQGLRALKLTSKGGPDGISSRLLNYLARILPNLVLGSMQEITLFENKPDSLSERFFIFINKVNSSKTCYKKLRPINLISNLLKITSRVI